MRLHNIILIVDNYKHCHYPLYPPNTEYVSSSSSRGEEFGMHDVRGTAGVSPE